MFLIFWILGSWDMFGWNEMYLSLFDLVIVGFININIEYILVL